MKRWSIQIVSSLIGLLFCSLLAPECSVASGKPIIGPVLNAKVSYPQTVSAELGVAYLHETSHEHASGPFLSYEPGINGQKLHLGYSFGSMSGDFIHGSGDPQFLNFRISMSYYKPWSEANGFQSNENYYGVELVAMYDLLLLSGGIYNSPDSRRTIGTIGAGIGW